MNIYGTSSDIGSLWAPQQLLSDYSQLELWNALVSWRKQSFQLAKEGATAVFDITECPSKSSRGFIVQLQSGPKLYLVMIEFPFEKICGLNLLAQDIQTLPDLLRDALNFGMVNAILSAIPDNPSVGFEIIATGLLFELLLEQKAEVSLEWFSVECKGVVPGTITFLLGVKAVDIVKMVSSYGSYNSGVVSPLVKHLTTDVSYTLGNVTMVSGVFNSLSPGTVVVLPKFEQELVLIRVNWNTYAFRRSDPEGQSWVCEGYYVGEKYRVSSVEDIGLGSESGIEMHSSSVEVGVVDKVTGNGSVEINGDATASEKKDDVGEVDSTGTGEIKALKSEDSAPLAATEQDEEAEVFDDTEVEVSEKPEEIHNNKVVKASVLKGKFVGTLEPDEIGIDNESEPTVSDESSPGSSIMVAVDFDLGRTTVPLSEVGSWVPGAVVELFPYDAKAGVEVTLRVNGRAVGVGDLLSIDDRLAVRVTRLFFVD